MKNQGVLYGIGGIILGSLLTFFVISNTTSKNMMSDSDKESMTQMMQSDKNMNMGSMNMSGDEMVAVLKGKTGAQFDKAFMDAMIEHHTSAIAMAKEAKMNAGKEEIKKLAEDIIAAQTKEIDMMREWQQVWGYK